MKTDTKKLIFEPDRSYGGINWHILNDIAGGQRVLDVGCATGKLGELIRKNGGYVTGIELNESLAEQARASYDEVVVGNVENMLDLPFRKNSFDVLVFADILEHLQRPDLVLCRFKEFLRDGGYALISVPNAAFIYFRLQLLFGRFNYHDRLTDPTHLRFFTLTSLKQMITQAGFQIDFVKGITDTKRAGWIFKPLATAYPKLLAYGFFIKACKESEA
jgi:2-polyprenyl-3-methyl-5-hydroxy-6-metoxy-1,4-benzoquinol methylase